VVSSQLQLHNIRKGNQSKVQIDDEYDEGDE
jgi:hypothetical protein